MARKQTQNILLLGKFVANYVTWQSLGKFSLRISQHQDSCITYQPNGKTTYKRILSHSTFEVHVITQHLINYGVT